MLTKIHEYKCKQELYIATNPEILNKLTDMALIQSTEASNKIEGVVTTDGRLKQIVAKKVKLRNRDVLKLIHGSYERVRFVPVPTYLTPDLIEELCYQYNQAVQKAEIDPLLLIPCFF